MISRKRSHTLEVALNQMPQLEGRSTTFRVDLASDEIARQRMGRALAQVASAKGNRTAELRLLLLGEQPAEFSSEPFPHQLEEMLADLNSSQKQAVLTNTSQRIARGFNVGLFLVSDAGLIVASVMLQSSSFSRSMAYVGILAWTLSSVDYLRQIVTQSTVIALLVILPNALLLVVWFLLVGRRLYQLRRPEREILHRQE